MNIEHLPCGELQFSELMPMAQIEIKYFDNKVFSFQEFLELLETSSKQVKMLRQYNRLQCSAIQCNVISAKEIKWGNRKKAKLSENF